uniref:C2H2-type domain-containing protein n=1 Tax=Timema cristinae TaxID=61476 RepID=A0A7R9DKI9_TIMCR|nr:unnamed protein product [Timema cristinae]
MLDNRTPRRDSTHRPKEGVAFPCQHCETAFTSPLFLEKHSRYCRGLRRTQLTKIPPAVAGSRPPETTETGPDTEGHHQLPLSTCETSLTGRRSLAKRGGERAHECLDCGAKFRSNARSCRASTKPYCRIHTGERPYQCLECKAKFALSGDLVRHRRTHTDALSRMTEDYGPLESRDGNPVSFVIRSIPESFVAN